MDEVGATKCICYMRNQEECHTFKEILERFNKYQGDRLVVKTIISTSSQKKRNDVLKEFDNHVGRFILLSVRILDECIDLPLCDSIFLSYEFKDKITLIQRLCRSNRKNKTNVEKKSKIFVWCDEYSEMTCLISSLKEFDVEFDAKKISIMNYVKEKTDVILVRDEKYDEINKYVVGVKKYLTWCDSRKLLFKFINEFKRMPYREEKYNNCFIWKWLEHQRRKIKTDACEVYKILSQNEIIKNNLDEYLINKSKKTTQKEWHELLLKYINEFKKIPRRREIYHMRAVGSWLQGKKCKIKSTDSKDYKLLSTNDILKQNLDEYLENKHKIKFTQKEYCELLFKYVEEFGKIPCRREIYRNRAIGAWLQWKKCKFKRDNNDEIYTLLLTNNVIKKCFDNYLVNKNKNENKIKLTQIEWHKLLLEYIDKFKKIPKQTEIYKNCAIGNWLSNKKQKIQSRDDKIYKLLANDNILKKNLDKYLINKTKDKIKLTKEEWYNLLLKYVEKFEKMPCYKSKYNNYNIGAWFHCTQKNKIKRGNIEAYDMLSKNQIIKKYLDKYISKLQ